MSVLRCLHGMDSRFCSLCNKPRKLAEHPARGAPALDASLAEIMRFLNHEQVRATYSAVAKVLGLVPRTIGAKLGPRCVEASWIVSTATGLPVDYAQEDMHPALLEKVDIITSGGELIQRMSAWKRSASVGGKAPGSSTRRKRPGRAQPAQASPGTDGPHRVPEVLVEKP